MWSGVAVVVITLGRPETERAEPWPWRAVENSIERSPVDLSLAFLPEDDFGLPTAGSSSSKEPAKLAVRPSTSPSKIFLDLLLTLLSLPAPSFSLTDRLVDLAASDTAAPPSESIPSASD